MRVTFTVNGRPQEADDVWEGESLLYVLRERIGLPGSKNACEQGECGSCTVRLDGVPVCACLVAAGQAEGREVVTVEGLADHAERRRTRRSPASALEEARRWQPVPRTRAPNWRPSSRRSWTRAPSSAASAPRGCWSPPTSCWSATRSPPTPTSARRSPATCAAAPATRRSSTRSAWRPPGRPEEAV